MSRCTISLTLLSLAWTGTAQLQVVSPGAYLDIEGISTSSVPLSTVIRYQQIHGDMRGTALNLRAIALRRDGIATASQSYASRVVDLSIVCSDANLGAATSTFANNYAATPVNVWPLAPVNLPSRIDRPRALPGPFDVVLPFAVPFAYSGQADLLWEFALHQTSSATSYPTDVANSSNILTYGTWVMNGVGCTTATGEFTLRSACDTSVLPTGPSVAFRFGTVNAPPNTPAALLIGLGDPNLPVPGLCANLRVNPVVTLPGTSDANGFFDIFAGTRAYDASLSAAFFDAQAAVLDASQSGLGLAVSNGVSTRINNTPPTFPITRVSAGGNATATSGSLTSSLAVVVRFDA